MSELKVCVCCEHPSKRGETICGSFVCEPCVKEMLDDQVRRQEEIEWAELNRVSERYGVEAE